jgi:DDE family transposase
MASVSRALSRIKEDLAAYVPDEAVLEACRAAGHTWRDRLPGPVATFHLFVLQLLHLNTAIRGLRHLAKPTPAASAAAYCRARMRLPLEALRSLLRRSGEAIGEAHRRAAAGGAGGGGGGDAATWRGHRVLLLDGTSSIAPDTPASRRRFKQPTGQKPGCGFPVPKLLGMIDGLTGVVLEMLCFPLYTHEAARAWQLHPRMRPGDLVAADRGLCSFAHLALLHAAGVLALLRMHQRQIVDFRPHRKHKRPGKRAKADKGRPTSRWVRRLGKHDQLVDWVRPADRPKWMKKKQYDALPATLRVREVRYRLPRKGQRTLCVTVVTTLLDPALYPREAVAELYGLRWRVETHFGELKTTLKMRKVKCRTPDGVEKELIVYCLVYNLVHATKLAAARRQHVEADRISFIDALRWMQTAEVGEALPDLVVNPSRPDRHEPRVIKDLQDTYRKMTRPRKKLRQALKRGQVVSRGGK